MDGEYDYQMGDGRYSFYGLTLNARTKEDGVIGADRIVIPPSQYSHIAVANPLF